MVKILSKKVMSRPEDYNLVWRVCFRGPTFYVAPSWDYLPGLYAHDELDTMDSRLNLLPYINVCVDCHEHLHEARLPQIRSGWVQQRDIDLRPLLIYATSCLPCRLYDIPEQLVIL